MPRPVGIGLATRSHGPYVVVGSVIGLTPATQETVTGQVAPHGQVDGGGGVGGDEPDVRADLEHPHPRSQYEQELSAGAVTPVDQLESLRVFAFSSLGLRRRSLLFVGELRNLLTGFGMGRRVIVSSRHYAGYVAGSVDSEQCRLYPTMTVDSYRYRSAPT